MRKRRCLKVSLRGSRGSSSPTRLRRVAVLRVPVRATLVAELVHIAEDSLLGIWAKVLQNMSVMKQGARPER